MKVRQGFVSNSSSSSFTCQISGETVSGMDISLEDMGMCECENGHLFCKEYLINAEEALRKFDNDEDNHFNNDEDNYDDPNDNIPEKYCPLCVRTHATDTELLDYILRTYNLSAVRLYNLDNRDKGQTTTREQILHMYQNENKVI